MLYIEIAKFFQNWDSPALWQDHLVPSHQSQLTLSEKKLNLKHKDYDVLKMGISEKLPFKDAFSQQKVAKRQPIREKHVQQTLVDANQSQDWKVQSEEKDPHQVTNMFKKRVRLNPFVNEVKHYDLSPEEKKEKMKASSRYS